MSVERVARIYQRIKDAIPAHVANPVGCADVVLFVMILFAEKNGLPVSIQELCDHFPGRDCAELTCAGINCGLLETSLQFGHSVAPGPVAQGIIRNLRE